jgi:hypothetical protein
MTAKCRAGWLVVIVLFPAAGIGLYALCRGRRIDGCAQDEEQSNGGGL